MNFGTHVVGRPKRVLLGDVPYPSTRDLTLLLLLERQEVDPDSLRAELLTQEGIARAIGATPSMASKILTALQGDGCVQSTLARRFRGRRHVRTYRLTYRGVEKAESIRERLKPASLEVRFPDGSVEKRSLAEIPFLLGKRAARYTGVLVAAPEGKLDVASFSGRGFAPSQLVVVGTGIRAPKRFFGRREELEALQRFLDRPGPPVFVVWGPPGIGKTTLALQFASENLGQRFAYVALASEDTANSFAEKIRQALSPAPSLPGTPETLDDVRAVLSGIVKPWDASGSVLILDQVHVLSPEARTTLARLVQLVCDAARPRLILVGRSRPHAYSRALVTRENRVTELRLGPLDRESSRRFAEYAKLPREQVELALRVCGGNPLMLSLVAFRGETPRAARSNFTEYVREEILSKLPRHARAFLESLAVHDRPFGSTFPGGAARGDLQALVDIGLIQELGMDRLLVHEEFREAILETLGAKRLALLRRRAACSCLHLHPPDSVGAARFLAMAGDADAAAHVLLPAAYDLVEEGRAGDVLGVLSDVISLVRNRETKAEMLLVLGECHLARGEWGKADLAFQGARQAAPSNAGRILADALLGLGAAAVRKGDPAGAEPLLEAALKSFEKAGMVRGIVRSSYLLAAVKEQAGQLDEAWEFASRSRSIARAAIDVREEAFGLAAMARVMDRRKDYGTAAALYEQAIARFEEAGAIREAVRVRIGLGGVHCECCHYPEAADALEAALRQATEMGDLELQRASLFNLAYVRLGQGNAAAASGLMDRCYEAARAMGNMTSMIDVQARRGQLSLRAGAKEEAVLRFEEAISLSKATGATEPVAVLEKIGWLCLWEHQAALARRYAARAARETKRFGAAHGGDGIRALLAKLAAA